jgi:hypothetical protein
MAKTAQVLSNLNENFFDFFDLAVKNFCGSRIAHYRLISGAYQAVF